MRTHLKWSTYKKILRPMNSIVTGHIRGRQCSLRWTPLSIEHRCLEYCYTKEIYRSSSDELPGQSSIDALTTTTPNKKYIGPPQSIEHRGLAYHYTNSIVTGHLRSRQCSLR